MEYKAVTKCDPNAELTHWKYIKREKVNGKWRYYYDDSELKKFDKGVTEKYIDKDGTKVTVDYKKTDNIFGGDGPRIYNRATEVSYDGKPHGFKSLHTSREQGKWDRSVAKAEKWIFDNFVDPRKQDQIKRTTEATIEKGKKKINDFFNKIVDVFDGDEKKESSKTRTSKVEKKESSKTHTRKVETKKQSPENKSQVAIEQKQTQKAAARKSAYDEVRARVKSAKASKRNDNYDVKRRDNTTTSGGGVKRRETGNTQSFAARGSGVKRRDSENTKYKISTTRTSNSHTDDIIDEKLRNRKKANRRYV